MVKPCGIRTTMNVYGDVVTGEMSRAKSKVVALALNGTETAHCQAKWFVLAEACASRTHPRHREDAARRF
jgi:hypothetical protein